MKRTDARSVNNVLGKIFQNNGLPTEIVSDNGPPFTSYEFANFCKNHDIILTHTPPYHPQSNSYGERYVQTVKKVFAKNLYCNSSLTLQQKVMSFLINQNNIPNTVTGLSPTEVMYKYKPKMLIDVVNIKKKVSFDSSTGIGVNKNKNEFVNLKQNSNKKIMNYNELKNDRFNHKIQNKFNIGDIVLYRNHFKDYLRWIPARVIEIVSKTTYLISVNDYIRYVHENQIKKSSLNESYHPNLILAPESRENGSNIEDDNSVTSPIENPIEKSKEILVEKSLKNDNFEMKKTAETDFNNNKKSSLKKSKINPSHKPKHTCLVQQSPKKKRIRRPPDYFSSKF